MENNGSVATSRKQAADISTFKIKKNFREPMSLVEDCTISSVSNKPEASFLVCGINVAKLSSVALFQILVGGILP